MAGPLTIRDLRDAERAWADERYRAIQFAITPPGSIALVAERAGARVGLGRLVAHAGGAVELGGIWTDEAARGGGVARAMVSALLARAERPGPGERPEALAAVPGAAPAAVATEALAAVPGAAPAAVATDVPVGRLWCIPFAHLATFYQSFGFVAVAPPWPLPITAKVAACIAHALPDVVVLAR